MFNFTLLLALLFQFEHSRKPELTRIDGKFNPDSGATIYLMRINYFEPIQTGKHIIDSANLNSNKEFRLDFDITTAALFYLSTNRNVPPTLSFLEEFPQSYYYSFCSKFYSNGIYLYMEPGDHVSINWLSNNWPKDSVAYHGSQAPSQQFIRSFYNQLTKQDFDSDLRIGGSYKMLSPGIAFEKVNTARDKMINLIERNKTKVSKSLFNYLRTEIELGSLNQFLNWYEYVYKDSLGTDFALNQLPEFYVNAYESYAKSKWNTSSIEFYKFTERYVTYHTNRTFREFKKYYRDKDKKLAIASRCLPRQVKFEYTNKVKND